MADNIISDLIHKYFNAYETDNRNQMEEILADDFTFSSPHDDKIDKETYFALCWVHSKNFKEFKIDKLFVQGSEAFVHYLCTCADGHTFSNTELFTIEEGKIKTVDVYFGKNSRPEGQVNLIKEKTLKEYNNGKLK